MMPIEARLDIADIITLVRKSDRGPRLMSVLQQSPVLQGR